LSYRTDFSLLAWSCVLFGVDSGDSREHSCCYLVTSFWLAYSKWPLWWPFDQHHASSVKVSTVLAPLTVRMSGTWRHLPDNRLSFSL